MKVPEVYKSSFAKVTSAITIVALVFIGSFAPHFAKIADAGSLTALKDTLSPATGAFNAEKASTVANHTIVFTTPTGIAAAATLTLTFDNSTNLGTIAFGDIDLQDNGTDVTLAAAPSGTTWGVTKSGLVITFVNGSAAVAAGHTITIKIGTNASFGGAGTNQITNGTAGTTLLTIGGTFGDTGTIGIPIISNDVVTVNALVQPTITFTVSNNAIYFGNLKASGSSCWAQNTDPGAVTCPQTSANTAFSLTAGTNASSGYIITMTGDTLKSGANSISSVGLTSTAPVVGSSQFGVRMDASGGSGTVTSPYATAGQYAYPTSATTPSQVASASAPSATTTYNVQEIANITAVQPAGTYTTSQTFTATATY